MRQAQCFTAHRALWLALLAALIGAEDGDDEDKMFSEFEDDSEDSDGISVAKSDSDATTTTTTISRLRRDELPEDGFVWPTTDEEHYADQLPNEHRCNGCKGVAFQIDKALQELMPKGGKRTLAEHEFTEAMECRTKIYDDYGLKKLADKSRVLVGPGLPNTDDQGSVFGGAKWPTRMARYCGMLVGDLGEEEVYRLWVSHGSDGFSEALCSPSCEGGRRQKTKREKLEEDDVEPVKKKKKKGHSQATGEAKHRWPCRGCQSLQEKGSEEDAQKAEVRVPALLRTKLPPLQRLRVPVGAGGQICQEDTGSEGSDVRPGQHR